MAHFLKRAVRSLFGMVSRGGILCATVEFADEPGTQYTVSRDTFGTWRIATDRV